MLALYSAGYIRSSREQQKQLIELVPHSMRRKRKNILREGGSTTFSERLLGENYKMKRFFQKYSAKTSFFHQGQAGILMLPPLHSKNFKCMFDTFFK